MRLFLLRAISILLLLILLLAGVGVGLAHDGPFHPGSALFPIQAFAEQQGRLFYRQPLEQANYLLGLLQRRIDDLSLRLGSRYEYDTMQYLDRSFNQASLAISGLPQAGADAPRQRLLELAGDAEAVLVQMRHVPIEQPAAYAAMLAKVQTIQRMVGTVKVHNDVLVLAPAMAASAPAGAAITAKETHSKGGLIPWPTGSPGALHAFYPLTGAHAVLACSSCHDAGIYLGTPDQCADCHLSQMPALHYPGGCDLCHSTDSWTDVRFDHSVVASTACADCHTKDTPPDHYNGPCSACHITQNWTTVHFDHSVAGAVDCLSCHEKDAPANHYGGQCSNCHITGNWTTVHFDHTGFTDCASCHASDAPANHYSGQCSRCHVTSNWTNIHFDHSGLTDCQACHAGAAPANHYPYQCSLCHSTTSWGGGHFGHSSSYPDCISCHEKDRPADHDSGQCSECHNTSGWGDGGGGDGGLAPASGSILLSFNCSACHQANLAQVGEGYRQ